MAPPEPSATAIFYRNLRWLRFVDRFGRKGQQLVEYIGGLASLVGETAQAAGVPEETIATAEADHPIPAQSVALIEGLLAQLD